MVDTVAAVLATVVVLVILAVACLWAARRALRGRAGFMPGDAATPKVREAVALVGSDLACISKVAAAVDARGDALERADTAAANADAAVEGVAAAAGDAAAGRPHAAAAAHSDARARLAEARGGVREIVESVRRLRATLGTMPPTYQNALGLYRGLRDGDLALQSAAAGLGAAGARMLKDVGAAEDEDARELRAAAFQLSQMRACFASLVRSVHLLGDALQLE